MNHLKYLRAAGVFLSLSLRWGTIAEVLEEDPAVKKVDFAVHSITSIDN